MRRFEQNEPVLKSPGIFSAEVLRAERFLETK